MTNYSDMVPGESCFNLNFSNPGGSFGPPINLHSPNSDDSSVENSSSTSAQSTAAAIIAQVVSGVGSGTAGGSITTGNSPNRPGNHGGANRGSNHHHHGTKFHQISPGKIPLPNGKKTKGRVKIKMEFIDNKLRRYTTFSKRKTGIMKKAYELSTLTGTQVMLLVASETGHVYTFATKKLQPMITSDAGKQLIQTCLNSPDGSNGLDDDSDANSVLETGFHTSELGGSSTPTKQLSKGKNAKTFNDVLTRNGKGSPKTWQSGSNLPTMVPHSSAFGTMSESGPGSVGSSALDEDDEDDSDDSSNEVSPSAMQLGNEQLERPSNGSAASLIQSESVSTANSVMTQQKMAQMLFPAASLIPTSVTASSAAQAFGLIPGLTPGGTVMYQVPQGVVYAAPSSAVSLTDSQQAAANLMFAGLTGAADGTGSGNPGQQFITIPMSLSLQQMVSAHQQANNDNQSVPDSGRDSS